MAMHSEPKWRQAITNRFPERQKLPLDAAVTAFWQPLGLPEEEVVPVLELLAREYGLQPGFFRPDDLLAWLLEPAVTSGFLGQGVNSVRAGDRELALGEHLAARCKAHGVPVPPDLVTLEQFMRACAGLPAT